MIVCFSLYLCTEILQFFIKKYPKSTILDELLQLQEGAEGEEGQMGLSPVHVHTLGILLVLEPSGRLLPSVRL